MDLIRYIIRSYYGSGRMKPRNIERDKKLFELWRSNLTIDDASFQSGIPRSTVGYYYKKFGKRYGKEVSVAGKSREYSDSSSKSINEAKSLVDTFLSSMGKNRVFTQILSMMDSGKYVESYYYLMSLKLFNDVIKLYNFTSEEIKLLNELSEDYAKAKVASTVATVIPSASANSKEKSMTSGKEKVVQDSNTGRAIQEFAVEEVPTTINEKKAKQMEEISKTYGSKLKDA